MRLIAGLAGTLLLIAAMRSLMHSRSEVRSEYRGTAWLMGLAARRLTGRATGVRLLQRAGRAEKARRQMALIGDAGMVASALRAAAFDDPIEAFPGLRLVTASLGFAAAIAAAVLLGAAALPAAVALPVAAALAPDMALDRAERRVRGTVIAALPEMLDLLASCARAGRPLEVSLTLAADHAPTPLAALLRRAVSRQAAGQGPATALRIEADRTGIDRLVSLASLIERNRELGLPLEAPLRQLADAARAEARTDRLAHAARAVPLAGVLAALVVAPACVAALATVLVGGMLAGGVL